MSAIRNVNPTPFATIVFSLIWMASVGLAQTPTALQTVFVKSRQFEIPVSIDSRGTNRPGELQLYVSRDSGVSWEFYSRESPDVGRFSFSAPGDGEYWFAVRPFAGRSINGSPQGPGALASAGPPEVPGSPPLTPSLRIAVDTTVPTLEIESSAEATGVVALRLLIADSSPNTANTQLYYHIDTPGTDWVPVDPAEISWSRDNWGRITGQVSIEPRSDWRKVSIHATTTDQAGNQTTAKKEIERPRVAATPTRLASTGQPNYLPAPGDNGYSIMGPEPNRPVAPSQPEKAYMGQQPITRPPVTQMNSPPQYAPPQYQTAYRGYDGTGTPASSVLAGPINAPQNSSGFSSGTRTNPLANQTPANQASGLPVSPNSIGTPVSPSSVLRAIETESVPAPAGIPDAARTLSSYEEYRQVDPQQQLSQDRSNTPKAAGIDWTSVSKLPISETEVNFSRQGEFSLDYEFEAVGARGIGKVELWGTRDAGQTWVYWGEDPDKTSPFDISTSESGLYGFRMVAVDGQNLTSPQPQPGDGAEIYIMVDKTTPVVELVAARYGEMDEAGSLIIEYTYQDDNPVARPISLSFSDSPSGPWTTIATGMESTGRYVWPADPRLPKNLYLRVEATDRAGNTGIDISPTAISIRGLAPTARIKGFRSNGR